MVDWVRNQILVAVLLVLATPVAHALGTTDITSSACGGNTPEQHECMAEQREQAEARMQKAYESLIRLTRNHGEGWVQDLRSAQEQWLAFREKNCTFYGNYLKGGTGALLYKAACELNMTKRRADELEQKREEMIGRGYEEVAESERSQYAAGSGYRYTGREDKLCDQFIKNLRRFSDEPYGMACERKLDPAFGFVRPEWKGLRVLDHVELVEDIHRSMGWGGLPEDRIAYLKSLLEKGLTLELARIEEKDGEWINFVRYGEDGPCDPQKAFEKRSQRGRVLAIANNDLTEVERAFHIQHENIFSYKNRVYTTEFGTASDDYKTGGSYATLYLYGLGKRGYGLSCKFGYYPNVNLD